MPDSSDPVWADGPADRPTDDDVFAELVAHFHEEPDARGWPAAENVGQPNDPDDADGAPGPEPSTRAKTGLDRLDESIGRTLFVVGPPPEPADPAEPDDADDPDLHYIAPPPPRVRWPRPITVLALASIALGILVLAVPSLVANLTSTTTQQVLGVLLVLGGVGVLVARMGERPADEDDWPDDGAII
jgi:hypothetical protein